MCEPASEMSLLSEPDGANMQARVNRVHPLAENIGAKGAGNVPPNLPRRSNLPRYWMVRAGVDLLPPNPSHLGPPDPVFLHSRTRPA